MEKFNRATVDQNLRDRVFDEIMPKYPAGGREYVRINDRQYGILLTDVNGHQRYVRIGVIVAEEREDLTAAELMAQEQADYAAKVAAREEKARAKAEKIARDKARREEKKEEDKE